MESDEILDPFDLGTEYPLCTIGSNADLYDLYDSEPSDFTVMDTTDSQRSRWDHNTGNHSQALFRLGDENVVVQEGFTSFDQATFSPFSDAVMFFDASEEPSSYTNDEWNIQPGSLPDQSTQNTQICREIPQPPPSTGRNPGSTQPTRKQDYPTPPTSHQNALDELDERDESEYETDSEEFKPPSPRKSPSTSRKPVRKPPTKRTKARTITKRRNGHIPGIDRRTGQLTLIGRFPPLLLGDHLYACPHCYAPDDERSSNSWTTRNGYKYHLQHVCLANPGSTASEKARAVAEAGMELAPAARKKDFQQQCDVCYCWFKSEAGYKAHRETNLTTRDGLCINKGRGRGRGLVEEQAEMGGEEAMEHEVGAVPQMVTYEVMRAGVPTHEVEGTDYYVWQAAYMAVQQGAMHRSIAQGP